MGLGKFEDIQRDLHKMCVEQEEAVRAMAKNREDLFNCKTSSKRPSRW